MNDLEQIRDTLESAKTFLGQEILWKESNYVRGHGEKKYSELCVALSIIDRMIETPAPQGWKLVPIEPTEEMNLAGSGFSPNALRDTKEGELMYQAGLIIARDAYEAMISAAPTPAPTDIIQDMRDFREKAELIQMVNKLVADNNRLLNKKSSTPAPTENVDLDAIKLDIEKQFPSMNYTESSLVDVVIDHLANTGRLR